MVGERKGKLTVPCETKEVNVDRVAWFGEVVEEEKSNDCTTESSRQKRKHALEKFEGEYSVWTNPALEQDAEFSQLRQMTDHLHKE